MRDHQIYLIGGADDESGVLTETQTGDSCRLDFSYRDRNINAESHDFFDALCKIRLQLEPEGLMPFCYGASLNVYPSGMALDMGLGLRAYRLTIGKHSDRTDLVEIFAEGPDVVPTSVQVQREFYEDWLKRPRTCQTHAPKHPKVRF